MKQYTEANGIRSFPCLHGCLNCQKEILTGAFHNSPTGLRESLNWSAVLVLSPSFSGVCKVDQIPQPTSGKRPCDSLLFIWQPAPAEYMFSRQPMGTAVDCYLKSITSSCSVCFLLLHSLQKFAYLLWHRCIYS